MRKYLILSAAAALATGGTAMAEGLSYSYGQGELHLAQVKGGGESVDGSGLGVSGAYGFTDMLFGAAGIDTNKYSENGFSIRFTNVSLGVGGHLPITSMIDFVGVASLEHTKLKSGGSTSDTGWGLSAGVRGAVNDKIQWNGGLKYTDVGDFNNALIINAGARYYFMPAFSAGVDLSHKKYDDGGLKENVLALSARYDIAGL